MRRREFITLLGGAVVALPLAALAQKAGRTYRLGCLSPHPRDVPFNVRFFDKLRRAGFIDGQNLAINYLAYAAHIDLISQYAAELVIAQPDVIYAAGAVAILAVQQATKSIPIVGIARDMIGDGLVESFARPNGNTTGISTFFNELDGKRQDILIEAMPGIRRMAALAETSLLTEAKARALQEAARANNVELLIYRITRAEDIAATIDKAKSSGATALNVRVPDARRQCSADYGTSCSTAPSSHLSMGLLGRDRWLYRLRSIPRSVGRPYCTICVEPFTRHDACRSAGRTADEIRVGDQPQDR